jgi:L-fuconolactonase
VVGVVELTVTGVPPTTTMPIIDAHVHVWGNGPHFPWARETTDPPRSDASFERLLEAMDEAKIAAAVVVQYIGYRWDNSYAAAALKAHPTRFMGVCRVDPHDAAAPDQLSHWTEQHGFRGVRISPGGDASGDWFDGPLMRPLFARAAALGVPLLLLTKPSRLGRLLALLDEVPDVDVVLDHIADCDVTDAGHRQDLAALARHPRVFLKTGHVWSNSRETYPWRDQHALLSHCCELFGANRIMWGSDWSLSLKHASYAQVLSYLTREADFLTQVDLEWVTGRTAQRLWPFRFDVATGADREPAGAERA